MRRLAAALALSSVLGSGVAAAERPATNACLSSYEAAQRLRLNKSLRASKKELISCSRSECPAVLRKDCTTWLAEVDAALPSVVIVARGGSEELRDVEVKMDDELLTDALDGNAIELDPGEHRFHFEAARRAAREETLLIRAGEKNRRLEVDLGPARRPREESPKLMPVYGLAAFGVIGLGSFTFFAIRSHGKKNDLEACKGHCPPEDVNAVRRDQIVADVSLGLGLTALGVATWLYVGHEKERSRHAVRTLVVPTPQGASAFIASEF